MIKLFRTHKIEIIRKRLKDNKWLEREIYRTANKAEQLHDFYLFRKKAFFVGEIMAEYNTKKYNQLNSKLERRMRFLTSIFKKQNPC